MKNKQILKIIGVAILIAVSLYTSRKTGGSSGDEEKTSIEHNDGSMDSKSSSEILEADITEGNPSHIEFPAYDDSDVIVSHSTFTLSYNTSRNTPYWVAWQLEGKNAYGSLDRNQKFWADEKLPRKYRVDFYEYKESGYERGHMCPAGDMKWTEEGMHDCFYMSNICPQTHELNDGDWRELEEKCRLWAKKEGCLYICCGPIYNSKRPKTIGVHHSISVPDAFYKVVLSLREGKEKAIGFYYLNDTSSQPMLDAVRSVNEIENITGIDFFASLPDKFEASLESKASLSEWR